MSLVLYQQAVEVLFEYKQTKTYCVSLLYRKFVSLIYLCRCWSKSVISKWTCLLKHITGAGSCFVSIYFRVAGVFCLNSMGEWENGSLNSCVFLYKTLWAWNSCVLYWFLLTCIDLKGAQSEEASSVLLRGMKYTIRLSSSSVASYSPVCWEKIDLWKSWKHQLEHCHFLYGSECLWHREQGHHVWHRCLLCFLWSVSVTSQTRLPVWHSCLLCI